MSYTLIQAGSSLQMVDVDGNLTTLTLPSNLTIDSTIVPRFLVFQDYVYVVNSPYYPVTVDNYGAVRPVTPKPPQTAPTAAEGGSGSLSGTYSGLRYTFYINDADGNLITESAMSPASGSVTIASKMLKVTGMETSNEPITGRRIYRPTNGGTTLFRWIDLEGNTLTEVQDDLADASLSLLAAPTLGSPPHLTLIAEWRNRLWGVGNVNVDELRFAEADSRWSWPAANGIGIPGTGADSFGIRALMPRRDSLGVGRRNMIYQITGTTSTDFRVVKLSQEVGVESNESVVTYRDIVWWLWKDGIYQWDGDGIRNIADGKVKSWFTTDDYFNQDEFYRAFAVFDPLTLKYRVYLAATGGSTINRWIEYDVQSKTWWGPHLTSAFTPTSAFHLVDANDKIQAVAGSSSAFIWKDQSTATDDTATGISTEIITKWYDGDLPDIDKYWGELSVLGKVQSAGTLTVTPKVGYLDASSSAALSMSMSNGRQRLGRIGHGKLVKLTFTHSTAAQPVELYGFELPFVPVGRR